MTISHDQMMRTDGKRRLVFVPYAFGIVSGCGNGSCVFYDNSRFSSCDWGFSDPRCHCTGSHRKDGLFGSWKETHDHIT